MSLFEKLQFHAWDATGMIEELVRKWRPRGCATEKDYEKSL